MHVLVLTLAPNTCQGSRSETLQPTQLLEREKESNSSILFVAPWQFGFCWALLRLAIVTRYGQRLAVTVGAASGERGIKFAGDSPLGSAGGSGCLLGLVLGRVHLASSGLQLCFRSVQFWCVSSRLHWSRGVRIVVDVNVASSAT